MSDFDKLVDQWIDMLELNDWTISVKDDCKACEMELEDSAGCCTYDVVSKWASVQIISKEEYGQRVIPYDKEQILVHELLHCKFGILSHTEDKIVELLVHQLVEDMAKALVKSKRIKESKNETN